MFITMKPNQYFCLLQYLSTKKSFLLAPTRNTQLYIAVAFVSQKGPWHPNSSILDLREDKQLEVSRQKNDDGKLQGKLEREMQLAALRRAHNLSL